MTDLENGAEPNTLKVHLERPSTARIYDYVLDNQSPNNYAMDRAFVDRHITPVLPDAQKAARENRRFVGRVVEAALDRGIRQFVDIGSGLPGVGQPHEVADRVAPDAQARVVYVDNELIANAHSMNLLNEQADPQRHQAVLADFFNHGDLWRKVDATGIIDRDQPVCLFVTAVLHFMPDEDDPADALRRHRSKLKAAGSWLAISHVGDDDDDALQSVAAAYSKTTNPATLRSDEEIRTFFGDWDLVEPGLTWIGQWRPKTDHSVEPWWDDDSTFGKPWWEDRPARMLYRAGVAMKP